MKCDNCQQDLYIASTKMESALTTTKVECVQKLVCTNRDCSLFTGNDLNNPLQIAKTIRTEV